MAIKASLNNGLSEELKASFPDTIGVPRPEVVDQEIKDPHWLAGFASGDGCFMICVFKDNTKTGFTVSLKFQITQHSRDIQLIKSLCLYLGCGRFYLDSKRESSEFIVTRFSDVSDKIISFFDKYKIQGVKALDYADFKKVGEMMKVQEHLTEAGLEEILKEGKNNIRRIALGPAPTANLDYNKGDTNPQFGKAGVKGAALNYKHSPEQKALWSLTRSTPIFVYDAITLTFNFIIYGFERLAGLLGVHVNTARRLVKSGSVYSPSGQDKFILTLENVSRERLEAIKANVKRKSTAKRVVHVYNKQKSVLLKTFSSVNEFMKFSKLSGSVTKQLCESENLWLDEYFISYDLIPGADNSLASVGEFRPKLRERTTSIPVYTYSADGTTFIKRYSSLRECVKDLEGAAPRRNFNPKTLMLRIEHKELYHGLRVSYKPLFEHSI